MKNLGTLTTANAPCHVEQDNIGHMAFTAFETLRSISAVGMPQEGPINCALWVSETPGGPVVGPVKMFSNAGNRLRIGPVQPPDSSFSFLGKTFTRKAEEIAVLVPGKEYFVNVMPMHTDDGVASFFLSLS